MKVETTPKVQVRIFKGVKIIDLEDSDRSSPPPHVPLSPPRQDEEQREEQHMEEQWEEDIIEITYAETQIGIPPMPPTLELDLTPLDIQGRAFRDARKEACDKFLEDEAFIRSLTFLKFVWKTKIEKYKRSTEKMAQRLDKFDQENKKEVKSEMMEEFKGIIVEEGKMIVN